MTISTGTLRVGVLAILAGLIGAYVIQQVLQSKPQAVAATAPRVLRVPMAAADLPDGRVIAFGDIVLVEMSPDQLQNKGPNINTVMMDPAQIIGRRLRQPIMQGELFTTTSMFLEYSGPDISERLKPGFRAYSINVSRQAGSRYAPGMIVDVLFRTSPRPAKDGLVAIPEQTVTLLQSIEVIHVEMPPPPNPIAQAPRGGTLDIRGGMRTQSEPPAVITLAITAKDAKVMQAVQGHGEVVLSPWSAQDKVAAPESAKQGLTLEEILGIEPPPPVQYTPPFITEVYRRGAGSAVAYPRDAIIRYQGRPIVKAGNLPAPSAIPAPKPKPLP
jgi:Flp pilus assembly protein CpaB